MALNLVNTGRRFPQQQQTVSYPLPVMEGQLPVMEDQEIYTFNPTAETLNMKRLDAFRKPQINASPDVINVTEWIGWLIMPVTQEQELQHRLAEAKSKIVSALWEMVAAWHLASKSWQATAKALIDLYNKIR